MRREDYEQYSAHFREWASLATDVRSVALLSGNGEQESIMRGVFPAASVRNVTRAEWDLSLPGSHSYDLIAAMNVWMYSPDPDLWFRNVLARCRHLWIQDLTCGQRSGRGEVADGPDGDGDCMRYSVSPLLRARYEHAYDLAAHQERLVRLVAYRLDVPAHLPYGLSFMAYLRGDL